jgi:energy-coupling factor transporter ATP-binding protein EcfA2
MLAPHGVQTPVASDTTPALPHALTIPDSALSMGLLNIGSRGSGKTTLLAVLALLLLRKGKPQVIIDPLGTLTDALLFLLLRSLQPVPLKEHPAIWRRLRYIDVGNTETVTPFPIYTKRDGESLWDVSERLLHVLELSHPNLKTQSSVTWPRARRVASNAGAILAALSYQLTEVEDLFFNTQAWEQNGLFDTAITRCPEALPAVSYFREEYLPLRRSERLQLTGAFLDHVHRFSRHPGLRLLFGASSPGLDMEAVEEGGETVILDFRTVSDPAVRRFALLWIFHFLYDHIKHRGRRQTILGLMIDEFAELTTAVSAGGNLLAELFDEFLQRYMRNHRIFFSCAFQSITQLDEHLRHTVLSLGTQVIGKVATMEEARILADVLYHADPYFVKHWRNVWGTKEILDDRNRPAGLVNVVIDHEPEYMPLPEQLELASQQLTRLGVFHFLCRPAIREGEVSQSVIPITITGIVRDKHTGEYVFADQELVERVRSRLAIRSGIPAETIREEQEARLRQGTIYRADTKQVKAAGTPAEPMPEQTNGRHAATEHQQVPLENGAHPEPYTASEFPSRPCPDEQQRALLTFISEHPDTPVTEVYKALGIGVTQGRRIRETLKVHGLVAELEVRTGRTSGGRPITCLIPTIAALELLGKDAPPGRGGILHRYVQQVVAKGATGKGYSVTVEQHLPTGAIVDVHLEKGQQRIAVEIAVGSTPEREISHMRNCLNASYEQIITIFADEHLLGRTATALQTAFTAEELGKIRLVPLRQLAQVL